MAAYEGQLSIPAPHAVVRAILLEPAALPEWIPGFRAITAGWRARVGVRYPVAVRGGLTGYLIYSATGERRIETTWRVPGLVESASWTLIPSGSGVLVRHSFEHSGPAAALLRRGSFENVADLRLTALAERALSRVASGSRHRANPWRRTPRVTGNHPTPLGRLAGAAHQLPERDL
jgi:hypothetical protein